MTEVTYEDWQKNPTPRIMWVWDDDETCKERMMVIHISTRDVTYPVIALPDNEIDIFRYKHCAEIKKYRRMTNRELSRWLREKPTRECKWAFDGCICSVHTYNEKAENDKVYKDIYIREDDGDWREPLI